MTDARTVARLLSVGIFLMGGVIAFFVASVSEAEEAYATWSDPQPLGLAIFGTANLVSAGLAWLPGGTVRARACGSLFLAPAILLINASDSTGGDAKWLLVAGAAAGVVLGGVVAGGLLGRHLPSGRRR